MASRKASAAGQGNGLAAGGRERAHLELAELGPLLEEKGDQGTAGSASAEDPPCPAAREEEEEVVRVLTLPLQAHHAMEKMEEFVYKVWEGRWRVIPYDVLPDWLKDNDYLLHGHRPPMPSFRACFKSIFRIHTETGNIWTHLLGEGGVRDVLPGSGAVPQLLLAFPHCLLSLREGLADFFEVGLFGNCTADHGELCPVALLLVLLLPAAKTHLPLHRLCPGHLCHHRCAVGPVCHPQAQADKSRCLSGAGAERRGAHHALHHRRRVRESHHRRPDGLVLPHGRDVHHGRGAVRRPHTRALLPGQVRHLVSVASDLPRARGGCGLRPLLRGVEPAGVSLRTRRGVHRRLSPLRAPDFSTSFLSAF
ncbi:adiponectin receptor protein 1 isoform 2-T2 [Spheniscus humboldti]